MVYTLPSGGMHLPVNNCDYKSEGTHPAFWILPSIADSGMSACPDILLGRTSAHTPAFCQTHSNPLRYPYHNVSAETAVLLFGLRSSACDG